jgi:hypothetical protein
MKILLPGRHQEGSIRHAEARKNKKYKERECLNAIGFMPMALVCYGVLPKDFMRSVMQYWYRKISCKVHKSDSRAISKMEITNDIETRGMNVMTVLLITNGHEYANTDTVTLHIGN